MASLAGFRVSIFRHEIVVCYGVDVGRRSRGLHTCIDVIYDCEGLAFDDDGQPCAIVFAEVF